MGSLWVFHKETLIRIKQINECWCQKEAEAICAPTVSLWPEKNAAAQRNPKGEILATVHTQHKGHRGSECDFMSQHV